MSAELGIETMVEPDSIAADLLSLSEPPAEEPVEEENISEPTEQLPGESAEVEEQPKEDSETTVEDDAEEIIESEAEESEEAEPEVVEEGVKFTMPDGSEVDQKQLIDGYMRQADYTRKTAELAEQRRQGEQQIEEQNAQIANVLNALVERYHAFDPRAPYLQALHEANADGDTERATQLQAHINGLTAEIERYEKAKGFEDEKKQGQSEKSIEETKAHHQQALLEKMPELKEKEKAQEFGDMTNKALKRLGWGEDEIAEIKTPDHRDAMAYYYAEKYFQGLKTTPKVQAKLKGKAVTPKTQPRKAGRDTQKEAATAKFNKNPNAEGNLAGIFLANGV